MRITEIQDWIVNIYERAQQRGRERKQAIAEAQVALGFDSPKVGMTSEQLWKVIATNHCPDCKGTGFIEGPSGGMSTNISCATCGHRFNVTPIIQRADRI